MNPYEQIDAWVDAHFDEEVQYLQALVQVPTDTPPGNNTPHAERTAALLQAFGYQVEAHTVPVAEAYWSVHPEIDTALVPRLKSST